MNRKELLCLALDYCDALEGSASPASISAFLDYLDEQAESFVSRSITRSATSRAIGLSAAELSDIVAAVKVQHITHPVLRRIEGRRIAIPDAISFRRLMIERSEERRLGIDKTEWLLDNKVNAYQFCDALGVRRPSGGDRIYSSSELPAPRGPVVLKPVQSTGSRGVFLVSSTGDVTEVRTGGKVGDWSDLVALIRSRQGLKVQGFRSDRWMMEELVLEDSRGGVPARDLKFYTFYGEILYVLEIVRKDGVSRHCFWAPDGERLTDTGRYADDNWIGDWKPPVGIDEVKRISLEIPVPFMRIDMLQGEDGLVLGEFTPRPGQFNAFTREYDRELGIAYLSARARIARDLLAGKKFTAFSTLL